MATTTAIAKPNDNMKVLRDLLEKSKDQIRMALPKHLTPERMIRVAMTAVQKTPKLQQCELLSLVGAVVQASQLGLEPDGVLGQAYLVPFWNGKTQRNEAQLQIGYRGFIALARRSGDVQSISAHVVYGEDQFEYCFGLNEKLDHKPSEADDRGEPTHAWALVRFKDGGYQFDVMTTSEIEKIRESSKAKDSGPWQTHWPEMAKKTVIRRLAKMLPLSTEDSALVKAAVLDEYADAGIPQGMVSEVESAEVVRIATAERANQLAEKYSPDENQDAEPVIENPQPPVEQQSGPALRADTKSQPTKRRTEQAGEEPQGVPLAFPK